MTGSGASMYHSLPDTIPENKKKKGKNFSDSEKINDCQILVGSRRDTVENRKTSEVCQTRGNKV